MKSLNRRPVASIGLWRIFDEFGNGILRGGDRNRGVARPWGCKFCGERFSAKRGLIRHLRNNHFKEQGRRSGPPVKRKREAAHG
jgi:hypothetical protein